jgi:hypothetical protein
VNLEVLKWSSSLSKESYCDKDLQNIHNRGYPAPGQVLASKKIKGKEKKK